MDIILRSTTAGFEALSANETFRDSEGVQTGYGSLLLWSDAELLAKGLYKRTLWSVPEGMVADGVTWASDETGAPIQTFTNLRDREPPVILVPKRVMIDRLQALGKLDAAYSALQAQDLYTRERWNTRSEILASDPTARGLLTAIGVDPDVILAPE